MTSLKYIDVTITIGSPKRNQKLQFVNSGVTLFFNAQHILVKLHPNERAFFDYLCERMNISNNAVRIDSKLKDDFKSHIGKITSNKVNPSTKSITRYVKKLVGLGLIILNGSKLSEAYIVNPKYVFKGTLKQRKDSLKSTIEDRDQLGLENKMLVNSNELLD